MFIDSHFITLCSFYIFNFSFLIRIYRVIWTFRVWGP